MVTINVVAMILLGAVMIALYLTKGKEEGNDR